MKKLSKLSALLLALAMMLSLAACSSSGSGDTTPSDTGSAPSDTGSAPSDTGEDTGADGATYTVGICQQMTHDALDAATQGFKDALNEALPGQVTFEEQDAGGEYTNCATIVDGFVAEGVDLILANATYPLQAAASATADIPILGTLGHRLRHRPVHHRLDGHRGGNISGTSDLAPLDQQADMLQELFPDATTVGLLYCSGEPNSVYQVTTIQGYLEEMGYTCEQYAFTDVNDLSSVAQTACDGSDVIYIPTDNTAAANTETIANVVIPAGGARYCRRERHLLRLRRGHPVHQLLRSRLHHRPDGCPDPHRRGGYLHHAHRVRPPTSLPCTMPPTARR